MITKILFLFSFNIHFKAHRKDSPDVLGTLRTKAQALATINQMSLLSPKNAAELGKSAGLRPEGSPLLELSFDPFRCVYTYTHNIHNILLLYS